MKASTCSLTTNSSSSQQVVKSVAQLPDRLEIPVQHSGNSDSCEVAGAANVQLSRANSRWLTIGENIGTVAGSIIKTKK